MVCDETFYRHFHRKQKHTHEHQHGKHHTHSHGDTGISEKKSHIHEHEEVVHSHPYHTDDPHHHPRAMKVGFSVFSLENKKEEILSEDVEILEFDDDQITLHTIFGKEKKVNARLKRIHLVEKGRILMLLEKSSKFEIERMKGGS